MYWLTSQDRYLLQVIFTIYNFDYSLIYKSVFLQTKINEQLMKNILKKKKFKVDKFEGKPIVENHS